MHTPQQHHVIVFSVCSAFSQWKRKEIDTRSNKTDLLCVLCLCVCLLHCHMHVPLQPWQVAVDAVAFGLHATAGQRIRSLHMNSDGCTVTEPSVLCLCQLVSFSLSLSLPVPLFSSWLQQRVVCIGKIYNRTHSHDGSTNMCPEEVQQATQAQHTTQHNTNMHHITTRHADASAGTGICLDVRVRCPLCAHAYSFPRCVMCCVQVIT